MHLATKVDFTEYPAGGNTMDDAYNRVFGDKNRVLVVFAHPDDMEIFCGGTVARLVNDGKIVRTICMTSGNKGVRKQQFDPEEFKALRVASQRKAATELGIPAEHVFNLEIGDGEVEDKIEYIKEIARHIREFRPDIVITHEPSQFVHRFDVDADYVWINHRDHRKTAQIVFDAVYPYSRDHAFFPDHIAEGFLGHEVHEILFSDAYMHRDAIGFEVSKFLDKKRKALECYKVGDVFSDEQIEGFMTEGQQENGWFEILGWLRGIH